MRTLKSEGISFSVKDSWMREKCRNIAKEEVDLGWGDTVKTQTEAIFCSPSDEVIDTLLKLACHEVLASGIVSDNPTVGMNLLTLCGLQKIAADLPGVEVKLMEERFADDTEQFSIELNGEGYSNYLTAQEAETILNAFAFGGNHFAGQRLEKELIDLLTFHTWNEPNVAEQARSLFTSITVVDGLEADTAESDSLLMRIYRPLAERNDALAWETFIRYMLAYLV